MWSMRCAPHTIMTEIKVGVVDVYPVELMILVLKTEFKRGMGKDQARRVAQALISELCGMVQKYKRGQ